VCAYTYEIPDERGFMRALLLQMKVEGLSEIVGTLDESKCEIVHYGQYSRKRWNAVWTNIIFRVPLDKYEDAMEKITAEIKQRIISIANNLMPQNAGLDVMDVSLSPSIEATPIEDSLVSELDAKKEIVSQEILPEDIKARGKEMADIYVYLYCVENALRLFIEKAAKVVYGDTFFQNLTLNKDIERKLRERINDENKNKWLRIRGDSEIFYLDFDDLSDIIRNNWDTYKPYFPNQEWITTKIDEMSKCRNLVAHNSYVGKGERDLIRVYFNTIMRQIGSINE